MTNPSQSSVGRPDEFFIGWLPMPRRDVRFLWPLSIVLVVLAGVIALLASRAQQSPGTGTWESDTSRTFDGIVYAWPYAVLRVAGDSPDEPARTILLVEEGKFGAAERVQAFDGQPVRVTGSLLHRGDRWMIELASGEQAVQPLPSMPEGLQQRLRRPATLPLGLVTLQGEIIDPKCYLGAMKPGGGKTHKACAMLCIAGGVPPMFVVREADHRETFFLLASEDGGPVGPAVIDFVGDPVSLTGRLEQQGDLRVLKVRAEHIQRR